jgi:prepilin-type N-terminal cleavage/methylation domain-containing protein
MKKGFTLIEMLVVISLIGVLAAIALISFGSVQKSARDTTRKSDLKQYQTALEMYGNLTNGLFPEYPSVRVASTIVCDMLNNKLEPNIICSEDPKSTTNGTYSYLSSPFVLSGTATATNYVLWAKLENKTPTTYWFVCSNGRNGESTSTPTVAGCSL